MSNATSTRTVSAHMLKWSLSRAINLGIFSKRLFFREITNLRQRKSTIDVRSSRSEIMQPDSAEFVLRKQLDLRRSRSIANINFTVNDSLSQNELSESEDEDEVNEIEIGVEMTNSDKIQTD